jgi:3-hydroxymyristoyl/3-hydroxydecanoyl-(acyl carrier protein) dehydratase
MKNINELLKILPHRYPFIMIDKVIKWVNENETNIKKILKI